MVISKKAQSFSADLLVVVIVILVAVVFLVAAKIKDIQKGSGLEKTYKDITSESVSLFNYLKSSGIVDEKNTLNVEKLLSLNYEDLKEQLSLKDDFIIVVEKDGKLVKLSPDKDIYCFGSSKLKVNGKECIS